MKCWAGSGNKSSRGMPPVVYIQAALQRGSVAYLKDFVKFIQGKVLSQQRMSQATDVQKVFQFLANQQKVSESIGVAANSTR